MNVLLLFWAHLGWFQNRRWKPDSDSGIGFGQYESSGIGIGLWEAWFTITYWNSIVCSIATE